MPWTCIGIAFSLLTGSAFAADWPSYRRDVKRSGYTTEELSVRKLQNQWVLQAPQAPRPAWPGPAKWDAYARIRGLRGMRDYDSAFQMVVVGHSLFYGSSTDDAVHCIDTRSGRERWSFVTDAPVRMAPTIVDRRVYFGSDDGRAYCVNADDGKLIWKSASVQAEQMILNNGRFISHWPCRTGVLVADGTAYFGLSLLPWRESYLCAVDAETGKLDGPGRFTKELVNQTLEGGLLLHRDTLITLRGRVAPFLFDRKDGSEIGALKDGGGVFAMLNSNGDLLHGPGNKTGWITCSNVDTRKKIHTFANRTAVVSAREGNVFLSDDAITAQDGETKTVTWQIPWKNPTDIIVAGRTAYVGGDGEVAALSLTDGKELWREAVNGRVFGLAIADDALFVSTDEGVIYCFRPSARGTDNLISAQPEAKKKPVPERKPGDSKNSGRSRDGLVGHWTFHSGMGEHARRRGLSSADRRVQNLAGALNGMISGNVQLREVGGVEALELDGTTNSILITDDHNRAKLPTQVISVEAWVRIDRPTRWGGIIGAVQDNGSYERGWVLGYEDSKFSFAVAGQDGPDKLTYLTSRTDFDSHYWYHVVGTYDGTTQNLYVNGILEGSSNMQQGPINYPPRAFYEMGAYHDKDENYRLKGMLHEVLLYDRALTPREIAAYHAAKRGKFAVPIRLASGPFAKFTETDRAVVWWSTAKPSPTVLELSGHGDVQRVVETSAKTVHEVTLTNLRRNRVCSYVIKTEMDGEPGVSQDFDLDTGFNFSQPTIVGTSQLSAIHSEKTERLARQLLSEAQVETGICLVIGIRDGSLAFELVRQSGLNVICVDTDFERIDSARRILSAAGVYGTRICARHVESFAKLPFIGRCANLIVSERQVLDGELAIDLPEAYRVLRPFGGVAHFEWATGTGQPSVDSLRKWLSTAYSDFELMLAGGRLRARIVRPALGGAGEWSHLYGRADNSAFGGETLAGASTVGQLEVQWIGRPGPRAQADRNGRKPSPLSKNGRLFVQGLHRLIGIDALNGTPLWSLEIPSLERFNMPRDCGNWCADDDYVFLAVRDECWQIDAQTGTIKQRHAVIDGDVKESDYDWSYIARVGNTLLGSAVKQGTAYTNFWGNADAGWYDARSGSTTFKVCSENLFSLDRATGGKMWTYADGVIINSTITATADHIYFVECRNPAVKASTPRRVGMPELWLDQYLVALNTRTGDVHWEKPINTAYGIVMFNMAKGGDRLILCSSNNKQYDVYAFAAHDGEKSWEQKFGWLDGKGDHGKAMSRPAIVGDTVYIRPRTLNLKTGEIQSLTMPGGGCGTYAATTGALFFRSGNVTAWNTQSGSTTSWNRLRPGCWLSTIPANGMLLSPEAGGGCSCGSWLESSVGFMPRDAK